MADEPQDPPYQDSDTPPPDQGVTVVTRNNIDEILAKLPPDHPVRPQLEKLREQNEKASKYITAADEVKQKFRRGLLELVDSLESKLDEDDFIAGTVAFRDLYDDISEAVLTAPPEMRPLLLETIEGIVALLRSAPQQEPCPHCNGG